MQHTCTKTLMRRWHRQFARQRSQSPRRIAALELLTRDCLSTALVEIGQVTLVIVYDELRTNTQTSIRLCGFRPHRVSHGVEWAGSEATCLFKDLALRPAWDAKGQRCELANPSLLELALRMNANIERTLRYLCAPRLRRLRLPPLYAGFVPNIAQELEGQGPEFESLCRRFGMDRGRMFKIFERHHQGLTLFPLDWVSYVLHRAFAVFADLDSFPRGQLIRLRRLPDDLQGYQGASVFDFFSNRYRK